ncbi:hypothetical protein [Emiliania huxleyi virus 99B1]|nr:hypothetical protein [Emiliania huxleyi virus 99B1]
MFRKMFKVCCNPDPNTYTYSDGYNITGNSDTFWRLFNNFEDTASMWVKDVLSSEKLNGTPGQLSVSDRFLLKTNCMHTDQDGRRFTVVLVTTYTVTSIKNNTFTMDTHTTRERSGNSTVHVSSTNVVFTVSLDRINERNVISIQVDMDFLIPAPLCFLTGCIFSMLKRDLHAEPDGMLLRLRGALNSVAHQEATVVTGELVQ